MLWNNKSGDFKNFVGHDGVLAWICFLADWVETYVVRKQSWAELGQAQP